MSVSDGGDLIDFPRFYYCKIVADRTEDLPR